MALTDTGIRNLKATGKVQKLSDGGGLYLHVTPTGSKLWRMAYRFAAKQKTLSFGAYPAVSLQMARKWREETKTKLAQGIDPGAEKQEAKAALIAQERELHDTFKNVANEWFASYGPSLTPKHAEKLRGYLDKRLFPIIGDKSVTSIEPQDILEALREPLRRGHIETAHKQLNLCGQVMRYAKRTGRVKYNVAEDLSGALPPVKVKNLAAITDPKEITQLLRDIDTYEGLHIPVHYCLKILPYVFTRPSELRLAEWAEFNFEDALWRIPAKRMKMRRDHAVPLASQVVGLLRELQRYTGDGKFLFPSIRANSAPISDAAPLAALRKMGYLKDKMCLHGFRSMASTRLNEMGYRPDVIEAQLAHKESDAVRLAYNRAEYMDERRRMMQGWANYLDKLRESGN